MNPQAPTSLSVRIERWPIAGAFTISRGAKTEAVVVVAELTDGVHRGRGECVPYARYGETVEGVAAAIEAMRRRDRATDSTASGLQAAMPAGAARNALDCAFWDLAAKRAERPVHELAGFAAPKPLTTAYTISLAAPDAMAAGRRQGRRSRAAQGQARRRRGDPARIAAVRRCGAARRADRRRQRRLDARTISPRTSPPARRPASR